jgi:hypothetical protein
MIYNHHQDHAEGTPRERQQDRHKHGSIGKELRDVRKLIWELLRTSCSCSNVTYGRQSSRCGQPRSP